MPNIVIISLAGEMAGIIKFHDRVWIIYFKSLGTGLCFQYVS